MTQIWVFFVSSANATNIPTAPGPQKPSVHKHSCPYLVQFSSPGPQPCSATHSKISLWSVSTLQVRQLSYRELWTSYTSQYFGYHGHGDPARLCPSISAPSSSMVQWQVYFILGLTATHLAIMSLLFIKMSISSTSWLHSFSELLTWQ